MQVFINKSTVISALLLSVCIILILSDITSCHILKEGELEIRSIGNATYVIIRGAKFQTIEDVKHYFLKFG